MNAETKDNGRNPRGIARFLAAALGVGNPTLCGCSECPHRDHVGASAHVEQHLGIFHRVWGRWRNDLRLLAGNSRMSNPLRALEAADFFGRIPCLLEAL